MKTYREQYDELWFSPEEKQAMIEDLLSAVPETQKRVSHKKRLHVLIAAVVAAALCAACASGALQAAVQAFGLFLGHQPEQTQVLGKMAQPIGASVTDNGVTLTVDAVLGDANSYAILYTLSRDDGGPLFPGVDDPAIINLTDFRFDEDMTETNLNDTDEVVKNGYAISGTGWGLRFSSTQPGDNAIHFVEVWNYPVQDGIHGSATATFQNLRAKTVSVEVPEEDLCIEGNWTVDFPLDCKDASCYLPTGQVFHSGQDNVGRENVLTGTIQSFRLSPFSLKIEYTFTFDEEKLAARYPNDPRSAFEPFDSWLENEKIDELCSILVVFTFQDGTEQANYFGGNLTARKEGKAIISDTFDKIIPLDTLKSITIGDLTVEIPEQ